MLIIVARNEISNWQQTNKQIDLFQTTYIQGIQGPYSITIT